MEVSGPPLILADCNVLCLRRRSSRSADVGQNIFFLQIMSVAKLREIYYIQRSKDDNSNVEML